MSSLDRVLVTGGGGFVGSHAVEYYAQRDTEVVALDNLSRTETLADADDSRDTSTYNWSYLKNQYPEVNLVTGDVRDVDFLADLVEGCDGIVHTAGQVAVTSSLENPRQDLEINTVGTFNILEAARQANSDSSVVIASTNKVYGSNVNEIPVTEGQTRYRFDEPAYEQGVPESFPIDGCEHTPYGVSKLSADLYVQDYAARDVVNAAAFRMSCIYGPRQFGNEDQGWVAHFAISAVRGEPTTIFGDGKQVRDVLYVTDLIEAYDAFLTSDSTEHAVYNIGGGPENTVSLREFLDLLSEGPGRPATKFDDWREGDQKVYISDITRARDDLNWEPSVEFEEGIDRFLSWYESR